MFRNCLNFLYLNLVAVLVGWALTAFYPDRVILSADMTRPVVYATDADRSVEFPAGASIQKFFLPTGYANPTVKCTPVSCRSTDEMSEKNETLLSAKVLRHLVLPYSVPVRWNSEGGFMLELSQASFAGGLRYGIILLLAEAGLLVMAVLLCWLARRQVSSQKHGSRVTPSFVEILVVSFVASLFVVILVPVQTYLSNASSFDFALGELASRLFVPFLIVWCVLAVLLDWARRLSGVFFFVLIVALVVCGYFEIGLLAHDYPELNGETIFFYNRVRGFFDFAIFPVVFLALYWLRWTNRNILIYVASVTLVMAAAASFDASKPEEKSYRSDLPIEFVPSDSVVRSCVHSPKKNVAVYLLDSLSTPHALSAFEADPELKKAFTGFTCYTNNVGMHVSTVPGVAGLTTGLYYDAPDKIGEYAFSCFTSRSFIKEYLDAKAAISFAPGSYPFGVSTCSPGSDMPKSNADQKNSTPSPHPIFERMHESQPWNLFEIVRFRLAPFLAKPYVMGYTASGWAAIGIAGSERASYPIIADAPIDPDCPLTLQFWHTVGSHGPGYVTHNGIAAPQLKGYAAKFETTWYALRQLAPHIESLKRRGLYDCTYIIVTADHGSTPILKDGSDADEPFERAYKEIVSPSGRMLPILWVKPLNEKGAVRFSNAPTSHAKIAPLVRLLATRNLDSDSTTKMLTSSNRVYRIDDGANLIDCIIDANQRLAFSHTAAGPTLDELPAIRLNHEYSLFATNYDDVPPIKFDQAFYFNADGPRMTSVMQPTRIAFKVPKSDADYRVRLTLRYPDDKTKRNPDGSLLVFTDETTSVETRYEAIRPWPDPDTVLLGLHSSTEARISLAIVGQNSAELRAIEVLEK